MKSKHVGLFVVSSLLSSLSLAAFADDPDSGIADQAKSDLNSAGNATGKAAKDVGNGAKHGAQYSSKKVKRGTSQAAGAVKKGAGEVQEKTKKSADQPSD